MLRIILLALILLGVGFVFLVKTQPWYISVGVVVVCVLLLPILGKWLLYKLFTAPFKMKGAVLRGAAIQLHAVEAAQPPAPQAAEGTLPASSTRKRAPITANAAGSRWT